MWLVSKRKRKKVIPKYERPKNNPATRLYLKRASTMIEIGRISVVNMVITNTMFGISPL